MANVYNNAKEQFLLASMNLSSDDLRMLLLKGGTYSPDDVFVADLVPGTNELTVSGYARQALASLAVTQNDTLDRSEAEANKVTFTSLVTGETITRAVVFKQITTDADSLLVAEFNVVDTPTNGGNIEIRFDGVDGVGDFLRLLDS